MSFEVFKLAMRNWDRPGLSLPQALHYPTSKASKPTFSLSYRHYDLAESLKLSGGRPRLKPSVMPGQHRPNNFKLTHVTHPGTKQPVERGGRIRREVALSVFPDRGSPGKRRVCKHEVYIKGITMLNRSDLASKYLSLIKSSLNNELYVDNEARYRLAINAVIENKVATFEGLYDLTPHSILIKNLTNCKKDGNFCLPALNETGLPAFFMRNYLEISHTMIGRSRLDNIQYCIETVLEDDIPGDVIETGIWRGGAIILMRAVLAAYGDNKRTVWGADSFVGVPAPSLREDEDFDISEKVYPFLSVKLEHVKELLARYDLLDSRTQFLEGWFKDTLPNAPIEQLSVLRLDGDLYESTMDALSPLYAKVSPGGFIIVDDYFSCPPCQRAVDTFRASSCITDSLIQIDEQSVFWRKSG